jgi:DNA-binding NtrC family response regulator
MKKFRVLIIDDEQSVRDALKLILEDEGFEVSVACCGRGGLERHAPRGFDLAITDVNLPDICGLELLLLMRAATPPPPVIVITAHYTPEVVATAKERGALAILAKPFLPSDIISLVRQASSEADSAPQL